ncbi:MAG: hypothetical protein ACE37H_05535 [Phycisphaeraceae bacterium]
MTSQHPIFDHIQRDAQGQPAGRVGGAALDDGLIPPPTIPVPAQRAAPTEQPAQNGQTAPANRPIAQKPRLLSRVFRRLMFSPAVNPTAEPRRAERPMPARANKRIEKLVAAATRVWLRRLPAERTRGRAGRGRSDQLVDVLTATPGEPKLPDEVFPRLHWGGQLLYVGESEKSVRNLAEAYDNKRGFVLEQPVTAVHRTALGVRLPGITPRGFAFLARKTQLIQPGDFTERFTYHVELTPCAIGPDAPDGFVVTKRVPGYHDVLSRLRHKFPDTDLDDLRKRAHKLVDHVFPTFLTREAAMLGILQTNLDPAFRGKVPKPLGIEKDRRGFVRTLHMNWMRVGGPVISQLDFAIQAAELLAALHDQARVMHLDLRMDNMVITPAGVGFVDFGSACRIGEEVSRSPMLGTLFTEMMRTSQIQRMLGKMIERGHVTNNAIAEVYGKVDKTVDAFYLAVQIAKPHGNPDLKQYIAYEPESDIAKALSALTAAVLRPKNPEMAMYKNASDLVRGLRRIERRVAG